MCLCVDADQTPVVILFFAHNIHQQIMFPLGFLHLEDKYSSNHPIFYTVDASYISLHFVVDCNCRPTCLECLLRRWWLWEDERSWSLSTCCICCSHIWPRAWGEMWRWGNSSRRTGRRSFSFTFTGKKSGHNIIQDIICIIPAPLELNHHLSCCFNQNISRTAFIYLLLLLLLAEY